MRTKLKGLTLIEIVVAMGVFVILMIAISDIFSSAFRAQRETTRLQHNLEAAQAAMNLMAKELRTSSIVDPEPGSGTPASNINLQFIDYSQNRCIKYQASPLGTSPEKYELKKWSVIAECEPSSDCTPDGHRKWCDTQNITSNANLVGVLAEDIESSAYQIKTSENGTPGPRRVGRVTVWLKVGVPPYNRTIQSTVSLRDFNYIGI